MKPLHGTSLLAHWMLPLLLVAAGLPAPAQGTWPDKPLTMIVPLPPGGALGIGEASKAAADGYTLPLSLSSISILPEADVVYGRKPVYTLDQLVPIARFTIGKLD